MAVMAADSRPVVEPAIVPTVHPVLAPMSAIDLPLQMTAGTISVWNSGAERRMHLEGQVEVTLGYRILKADEAAVFLTPSKESGESTYDVAIYLSKHVQVIEGKPKTGLATSTSADELLVSTRVTTQVQLSGVTPRAATAGEKPDELAVVKRGDQLRTDLANRPAPVPYTPDITITSTELALQRGWIAKGPGNKIIAGPAETALAAITPGGSTTLPANPPGTAPPGEPRKPLVFATADDAKTEIYQPTGERVSILRGQFYLMYTPADGKQPYELRAQRAVLFSAPEEKGAATQPAAGDQMAKNVTGAYLEGDVMIDAGGQTIQAERVFFDFTTNRAIMLDAVLSGVDEARQIPVYMRAGEVRQIARGEYFAKSAKFSTSEFYTPHYHIGASSVYLQEITPRDKKGNAQGPETYAFSMKDTTYDVRGVPIFYWPFLSGTTEKPPIPLRSIRTGYNSTYGLSIMTDWDLLGLAGQKEIPGVRAGLSIDYWGNRGPGGGPNIRYDLPGLTGEGRAYLIEDSGQDKLARDREGLPLKSDFRNRLDGRTRLDMDDKWSLTLQGSYISDPNFLEQFFPQEFETDSEHETSIYLKRQDDTSALSLLGKWSLFDFTSNADLVDDQFTTEKKPEVKYWRVGDNVLDIFTYYSESGLSNNSMMFTNYVPGFSGLNAFFPAIPANETFRQYYQSLGWTSSDVLRGDSRQELDLPLAIGDAKITPYATGRVTAWDAEFPDTNGGSSTTRLWGMGGARGSMEFWKTYDDVENEFFDLHRMRHVIEPEFNVFASGSNTQRKDLQPFDPDVEGISDASGYALTLHQKWQTKRGGEGHWRNVDWLVFDISWAKFYNQPAAGTFYAGDPVRGYLFDSRPELSQVQDAVYGNSTWRIGERLRFLDEFNYSTANSRLEQLAMGVAVDQSPDISYFIGNRYIRALDTNEVTLAGQYRLTRKYSLLLSESYDTSEKKDIVSSATLFRKLPRFNTAFTVSYDANANDTSFLFSIWPEGLPELGFGSRGVMNTAQ